MKFYIDGAYDFVDVRDVSNGLLLAAQKGKRGEVYIVSGERITVSELFATLDDILQKHQFKIRIPYQIARFASLFTPLISKFTHSKALFTAYSLAVLQSNSVITSIKARDTFGSTARPLKKSLKDSIQWFKGMGYI